MTKREKFAEWIAEYIVSGHSLPFPNPNSNLDQISIPVSANPIVDKDAFKEWLIAEIKDAIEDCPDEWLEEYIYNQPQAKKSTGGYARKQTASPYNSNPAYPYSYGKYGQIKTGRLDNSYAEQAAEQLKKAIDDSILDSIQNTIAPKLIIEGVANTDLIKNPNTNKIQRYSK